MQRWQRFRVLLKGDDEPVVVQTTARDFATVRMDTDGELRAMAITFQVVHAALVREGHGVPRDYDGFLDVLEAVPEPVDDEQRDLLDPMPETRSDTPP